MNTIRSANIANFSRTLPNFFCVFRHYNHDLRLFHALAGGFFSSAEMECFLNDLLFCNDGFKCVNLYPFFRH